jgi:hypothetical protein
VLADAARLASEGWASQALALGWSPFDLFGAIASQDGDPDGNGLAVWLRGRKVLAVTETCASVEESGGRAYFNRRERSGAVLLWELGK